jgi:outer membrane immunogenic protein
MICANTHNGSRRTGFFVRAALLASALTAPCAASAADVGDDFLRGSLFSGSVRWDGFVVGAHYGFTSMHTDFSGATRDQVAHMIRQSTLEDEQHPSHWNVLGSTDKTGSTYGGFVGYNWQMDSLVLGLDGAYSRGSQFSATAGPTSLNRVVSVSGTSNDVTITSQSRLSMEDYATLRGRVGYAFGQFLPYAVVGGALGRFSYSTTTSISVVQGGGAPFTQGPETTTRDNAFAPGLVAGIGIDIALLPNLFLRGEWEYVAFTGPGGIKPQLSTTRVGIGVKF